MMKDKVYFLLKKPLPPNVVKAIQPEVLTVSRNRALKKVAYNNRRRAAIKKIEDKTRELRRRTT